MRAVARTGVAPAATLTGLYETPILKNTTLREEIQARIAELPDTVLPDVLLDLEATLARQNRESSPEFVALMDREPRPGDLSGEDALELATEAVKVHRRERRR